MGVEAAGETPSLTGEFVGEIHRVFECTQAHRPRNQHQRGPICLCVAEEVTESWPRTRQAALFPFTPLPHIQHHNTALWVPHPGEYLRLCSLHVTGALRRGKKKGPNERTDQSSRKNTTKQ